MSKHKITTFDREKVYNRINELELVNEIMKNEFFVWMNENGYNHRQIKEVFDGKRLSAGEQSRFNVTVRRAKKEANISLVDTVIYLEESFARFKKILSVLDSETKFELKKEMARKFRIKIEETNLSQILE